jgi:hypothetical protein
MFVAARCEQLQEEPPPTGIGPEKPDAFSQVPMAEVNCGEFRSIPLKLNAPWLLGSGKLGKPWVRMQAANLFSSVIFCGDGCGVADPPGKRD